MQIDVVIDDLAFVTADGVARPVNGALRAVTIVAENELEADAFRAALAGTAFAPRRVSPNVLLPEAS